MGDVIAILGGIAGFIALVLTFVRAVRERARLHVQFHSLDDCGTLKANISISNTGTLPGYIESVHLADDLPRVFRWPILRALSFRTRNRWWVGWIGRRSRVRPWHPAKLEEDLAVRIEPGEVRHSRLTLDERAVQQLLDDRAWVVVTTGLRQYVSRIFDPLRNMPEAAES